MPGSSEEHGIKVHVLKGVMTKESEVMKHSKAASRDF